MVDGNLDMLLRTTDNTAMSLEQSKKFNNTKRKINAICKALTLETQKYDPQKTVENINAYIASSNKLDRILYSEISNYVFSLEMTQRGIFATNLEKLLLYSLDENNNVAEDSKKLIVKIYDHFQLALHQIENVNNIFANSIEEAKENLQKEVKGVEKEYISILGIFASIVLAFVGGITFSTSVLQNISAVSIFRLLLVIDFLAFVLINIIYILVKFIFTINEKNAKLFNVKALNITCLVIALVIIVAWLFNANQLPGFISEFLPWSK
ncbi:hypothetical protein ACQRBN_05275 [Bariatricus sp. SGI.154]|uniref:hypothetical protein n=1 Tax=Bariatricus sp. SGI.154 TaxID=3420549 RepID=UPI003D061E39